jgi:lipopolysaccharide export system protein LptA
MRLSIPRLRAVLIAGASLLVLVLVAYIGLGRYRSLMVYRQLLKRSGVTLTHDTNGFTYSQSMQGRTIFTLHAAKATQLGSGKWALHDAALTLYDRAGNAVDHISGSEIDYDEAAGVARAQGVVDMDLQTPQGFANGGRAVATPGSTADALAAAELKAAPAQPVHVRTSGLVYERKLGIASTDQRVELRYGGMQCTAVGAEFNSGESTLRLLAQVRMEGVAHGQPLHVTAASMAMNRESNVAMLMQPAVTSNGQSATADKAELNLRKDGSIERLQGIDHVVLGSETERITAARLDATLNAQTLPQKARLSGGVVITGADSARPMHGSAVTVDALFNAQGMPTLVTATDGAKLSVVDRKADARGMNRSMEGAKIIAVFVPGERRSSVRVSEVRASGSAHASGDAIVAVKGAGVAVARKTTQVWGDDLRLVLGASGEGKAEAQKLFASGHTVLRQDGPLEEQENSSGDTLEVAFAGTKAEPGVVAKGGLGIASAVQNGHVMLRNRAAGKVGSAEPGAISMGSADRAAFDGATQRLTLSGNAHLDGDNGSLVAPIVEIDQTTQDAEARGGVQATIENAQRAGADLSTPKAASVTHVLSESARFEHATKTAEFRGSDAQPARMWQDASQVQAARLLFDGVRRTFSARTAAAGTSVHAVFARAAATPKAGAAARPARIVRVASPKMDYNDLLREATFSGGVTMDASGGEVRGQRAVVFLVAAAEKEAVVTAKQPSPFSESIDRVVLAGSVEMEQPGRKGTGEQLLYTAATGSYVLTGTAAAPPRIVDTQQGNVTGATLLFGDAGSTIVVAGELGAGKAQGGRVRSEMSVRPKTEERH